MRDTDQRTHDSRTPDVSATRYLPMACATGRAATRAVARVARPSVTLPILLALAVTALLFHCPAVHAQNGPSPVQDDSVATLQTTQGTPDGSLDGTPLLRFPGQTIHIGARGGPALLLGDFEGMFGGMHGALSLGYAVYPELTVMLTAEMSRLRFRRERTQVDERLYDFQFLKDARDGAVESGVSLLGFDLSARVNFFPFHIYNVFATLGAGISFYQTDDFDGARIRPPADFPASIAVPLGLGGEYYLTRELAVQLQLRWTHYLQGDIDAYDAEELALEYNRRRPVRIDVPSAAGDNKLGISLGLHYTLFESVDYDGDLLPNAEEASLGTNPYEIDTDTDGLTDYAEVRVHRTSPLKPDTDDDGLGDYFEVTRYNTDPNKPDTDDDRLTDYEEVMVYNTDPNKPDTDDDMLSDYEEVILYHTNPRNPDTDYDGLDDFAEVRMYKTDPLRPDTDDDGIYDFNEVVTYKTNPRDADTDGDRLLDYDEIAYHGTSPLNPDTDGDGFDDAVEISELRSNPLDRDASATSSARKPFAEQPRYHAELLETRPLPGGGTSYIIAPTLTRRLPREPESMDSVVASFAAVDSGNAARAASSSAEAYTRYRRRSVQHVSPAEDGSARVPVPLRLDTLRLKVGDVLSFSNITFEFDQVALREEYVPILKEAAQLFRTHPGMKVEIRGHTDMAGDENYNQGLSERRALTVLDFLVREGVDASRMRSVGFGERQPIGDSATEDGRARNRRVEFYILSMDPAPRSER
ncbi:MAG: OmpA family protein [Bacteroidetes bacterium]|nr:OmpA family protein [Bacteroidota bacterium]